ncbi:MAG: F0F1 ATP synthase subunit B [Clostridiales bacterium]|nr:F0F1 ATP synthase subunit B [Clostridiales bacterium]MCF8022553.1 F0F1 ATP synthase subunit B [Clostridiales bacterium]
MGEILDALGLNATVFAQIVNFIVLLIFLRVVVYPHIVKLLEKRQQSIEDNVKSAEEERQKAEELRRQYEADMQKAKEEANEIIQKATKSGEEEAKSIIKAANDESVKIKEQAKQDIEREKEKAVSELREQVAELSIMVAGKVVDEKITSDVQRKEINEFIKEAGDLPC